MLLEDACCFFIFWFVSIFCLFFFFSEDFKDHACKQSPRPFVDGFGRYSVWRSQRCDPQKPEVSWRIGVGGGAAAGSLQESLLTRATDSSNLSGPKSPLEMESEYSAMDVKTYLLKSMIGAGLSWDPSTVRGVRQARALKKIAPLGIQKKSCVAPAFEINFLGVHAVEVFDEPLEHA